MRILIAQARAKAAGGAETYLHDLAKVLEGMGASLGHLDIDGHRPPGAGYVGRPIGQTGRHLWNWARVCHALPAVSRQYDGVILGYGEGPALQRPTLTIRHAPALFSHDPIMIECLGGQATVLRQAYVHACRTVARPAQAIGPTITNSRWTAQKMFDHCGQMADGCLYPKVLLQFGGYPNHQKRPFSIVALGRIVPNKRFEEAIALTDLLREVGFPAELDIIGRPADPQYLHLLQYKAAPRPYVRLHLDLTSSERDRLLSRATLGFHGFRGEHFGMAVAEMIMAGVVPLVFDAGGVCELVTDRALRFRSVQEAAEHAVRLLCRPDLRDRALAQLRAGPALTEAVDFDARARDILQDWIGGALRHAA